MSSSGGVSLSIGVRERHCRRFSTQHLLELNDDERESNDAGQPPSFPASPPLSSKTKNGMLLPGTPPSVSTGRSNMTASASVPGNSSKKGTLMEITMHGGRFSRPELGEPGNQGLAEDPVDDRCLYCYECGCVVIDDCKKHPIVWIKNVAVEDCDATWSGNIDLCTCSDDGITHAKKTAPEEHICVSRSRIRSAGLGVWAEKEIPLGAIFGPYGGEVVDLDALSPENLEKRSRKGYAWLVRRNQFGTKDHIIDATNPVASNWLRFVNCARNGEEQTLVTIQYRGKIYYRACKTIPPNVELLTFYGEKFARQLGITCIDEIPAIPSEDPTKGNPPLESSERSANTSVRSSSSRFPRRLRCSLCGGRFASRTALKRHISSVHYELRDFPCEICGRAFTEKGHMRKHVETVHDQLRKYPCVSCGKAFGRSEHMKAHVKRVHKHLREHKCELCGKAFVDSTNLKRHDHSVHKKLRGFECEICGKAFSEKKSLERHIDCIHKQLRQFACELCGKTFTARGNLENHVDCMHKGIPKYACAICGKALSSDRSLERHVNGVHKKLREYTCEICGKAFTEKGSLNRHVVSVHKRTAGS
ncbi:Probable histone-lysine N-methyltransferase prdm7 [Sparganum proliferum]